MTTTNAEEPGRVILRVTFTAREGDVDADIVGAGVSRRDAAQMLAKLAAELAQSAAREDEVDP